MIRRSHRWRENRAAAHEHSPTRPMLFAMSVAAAAALSTPERTLPKGRLLVGYATDRSLREDKVVAACRQGVNAVIWSFAHLEVEDDVPRVRPTFDVDR